MVDGVLPAWCEVDRILSERVAGGGVGQVPAATSVAHAAASFAQSCCILQLLNAAFVTQHLQHLLLGTKDMDGLTWLA